VAANRRPAIAYGEGMELRQLRYFVTVAEELLDAAANDDNES
jgi:hypothetical protein